LQENIAHLMMN